jgi:uncharacterized integral membrane protein
MTYTRSQNYTNVVVSKHETQTFEVVVVILLLLLLSFDVFVPTNCTSLIIFGQVDFPNILKCQFSMQDGLQQRQSNSPSNVYLQEGHVVS